MTEEENDDIRLELNQIDGYTGTKDTEMQAAAVRSCEADEQLKITSKRWIDNVKEDLQQRGSDMREAAERVRDRKQWKKSVHAAPSSATYW